jgi:hypothetical protein
LFRIDRARPLFIKEIMRKLEMEPDPWQLEVAKSQHPRILLNCCRQAGKSTIVAMIGLLSAFAFPFTKVLVVSRSHRQAREIIKQMRFFHFLLGSQGDAKCNNNEITFGNTSRIVSMPCKERRCAGSRGSIC